MNINYENKITVCGEVKNFKVGETKNNKKVAYIGIKNKDTNNHIQVTMYDREGLTYGAKDEKQNVTLNGLAKIFLDAEGKPKGVNVTAIGTASEFTTDKGTYENNNVFSLFPASDDKEHNAVFILKGIAESVARMEDADDNEFIKIVVGTLATRGKENETVATGINQKTVFVRDPEQVANLEDLTAGDYVSLKGYIVNILPKYDEFGDIVVKGSKEFVVKKAEILCESDELDEIDVAVHKRAKKLERGKSFNISDYTDELEDEMD